MAEDAAKIAEDAASSASTAGNQAAEVVDSAAEILKKLNTALEEVQTLKSTVAGDFAEFCEIVEGVQVEMASYTLEDFEVVWEAKALRFLAKVTERPVVGASESGVARIVGGGVVKYYANWPGADAYMNETRSEPLRQRLFMCGGVLYYWTGADLTSVGGSAPLAVMSKEQYEGLENPDNGTIYFLTE